MKKHEQVFHKTVSHNNPKSNLDFNNSGGTMDYSIPKEGIQRISDKKTGKVRVQMNTPIQPVKSRRSMDSKYDDRMSKNHYNLA